MRRARSNANAKRLLWLDLETTGLDPTRESILELAYVETDYVYPYAPRTQGEHVIKGGESVTNLVRAEERVQQMHKDSGLWEEIFSGRGTDLELVENDLLLLSDAWPLDDKGRPTTMLAGSSVHFDLAFVRRHMPRLAKRLHYRCFDVSAVREFCRTLGMPKPEGAPEAKHRAMADIQASLKTALECAAWLEETALTCVAASMPPGGEHT